MNKDKYIKSINKIKVDENLMKNTIEKLKEDRKENIYMKSNSKFKFVKQLALATATMFILTVGSFAGYVAISGDTRVLEKFGINLEGLEEQINVIQNAGSLDKDIQYTIKYSEDMILTKESGVDIYNSKYNDEEPNENGVIIPNVYMKIYTLDEDGCANMSEKLLEEIEEYKNNSNDENVQIGSKNYQATKYYIQKGNNWNSEVKCIYIVRVDEVNRLVIELNYFVEAMEGWGSKLEQMLSTLEIK